MKEALILSAASAIFCFSCASSSVKPSWIKEIPQPAHGVNYNYVVGEAVGSTEEEAKERAVEDAYKRVSSARAGIDLRNTAGVRYGIRCEYPVKESSYKHKYYVLLKYQIKSTASAGSKDDYNDPDGIKCESNGEDKSFGKPGGDENDKLILEKRGLLESKARDFKTLAQRYESASELKEKNRTWREGRKAYGEVNALQTELQSLGASHGLDSITKSAKLIYDKMHESCAAYSQSAKLHWNSEAENEYSSIAFSKLSGSIKIEKSQCSDKGISLIYKGAEPECAFKFGLNSCSYKLSLSINSCDGAELLRFNEEVMGAHQKAEFAAEKLQSNLKSAEFWSKWIREIKEWSLLCE